MKLTTKTFFKRFVVSTVLAGLGSTVGMGLTSGSKNQMAYAAGVSCNNQWAQQAMESLEELMGHKLPFSYCYEIGAGEIETTYITFEEVDIAMSSNHAFVADCDYDCADLDLRVYDEAGYLLDEDASYNKNAEVTISDIEVGNTYRIEMTMFDCDAAFCGAVLGTTPRR